MAQLRLPLQTEPGQQTAYESFWLPPEPSPPIPIVEEIPNSDGLASGRIRSANDYLTCRVVNQDNEVGMRVWEAGRVLAEYCVSRPELFKGRRVLELGAGVGMTGLTIAACCNPSEVVLTDYAPRVLANLRFNAEINRSTLEKCVRGSETVVVRSLDWMDYSSLDTANPKAKKASCEALYQPLPASSTLLPSSPKAGQAMKSSVPELGYVVAEDGLGCPEVVLAADVAYDMRFHKALVGVVAEVLRRRPSTLVLFASTVRNSTTLSTFYEELIQAHICVREVVCPTLLRPHIGIHSLLPTDEQGSLKGCPDIVTNSDSRSSCLDVRTRDLPTKADGSVLPTCLVTKEFIGESKFENHENGSLWCYPSDLGQVHLCALGVGGVKTLSC
ncbi:unnamed protein product [Choristocarpus tenellus]